jgi:hypothetical protein
MAISLTTPVTGGAQTGFTAPTYPIIADSNPDYNGKQWVVSGTLGGTQVGVTTHSASSPFSVAFFKPKNVRVLPKVDLNGGYSAGVPLNVYSWFFRKGSVPAANQVAAIGWTKVQLAVPAGSDVYSPAEIRGMVSFVVGCLNQASAGLGDTLVSSVM